MFSLLALLGSSLFSLGFIFKLLQSTSFSLCLYLGMPVQKVFLEHLHVYKIGNCSFQKYPLPKILSRAHAQLLVVAEKKVVAVVDV